MYHRSQWRHPGTTRSVCVTAGLDVSDGLQKRHMDTHRQFPTGIIRNLTRVFSRENILSLRTSLAGAAAVLTRVAIHNFRSHYSLLVARHREQVDIVPATHKEEEQERRKRVGEAREVPQAYFRRILTEEDDCVRQIVLRAPNSIVRGWYTGNEDRADDVRRRGARTRKDISEVVAFVDGGRGIGIKDWELRSKELHGCSSIIYELPMKEEQARWSDEHRHLCTAISTVTGTGGGINYTRVVHNMNNESTEDKHAVQGVDDYKTLTKCGLAGHEWQDHRLKPCGT
ncbi:hypothetical protein C8R44DRAFT_932320 [Mycena epipterygia]|nr:hypothetical protein C8R44DRAFT_932320 [Mycena epipterygia]